jgi:hypothetical protein
VFNGAVPLILLATFLRPVVAPYNVAPYNAAPYDEGVFAADPEGASRAFALYLTGMQHANSWSPETIEIEASLPKLNKHGRLRAIRRMNAAGAADYQVLETDGDRTVRQQVIARYLSAQVTAAEVPASSVAINPENYQFRYKGIVKLAHTVAYAFQIKPRKKRQGLIDGELWLEGKTGAAIRQSGYLVKSPSFFVKHVGITRETVLSEGVAQMLLTHLSVDTRLVGMADLTVTESPLR